MKRIGIGIAVGVALLVGGVPVGVSAASAGASKAVTCTGPKAPAATTPADGAFGAARDLTVTSFDGTKLVVHFFPVPNLVAGARAPTVMMGPGWGSGGDTDVKGGDLAAVGSVGIKALHEAGYNVMTWDPRGFGKSGGTVEINSPDYEGRDARLLLSWLATQPEVQLDAKGDPRVGMFGVSYGGGVQLLAAAADCRVDAIVPTLAWHALTTSLYKADTIKISWAGLLFKGAAGHSLDAHIQSAYSEGQGSGVLSGPNRTWFTAHGPADRLVGRIKAPTLLLQGTVDTLFSLDEAVANYRVLRAQHVPVAMLWFCGGHGICLTDPGDQTRVPRAAVAWLNRYVKRDRSQALGPRFDLVDQNGTRYTASDYPVPADGSITGAGKGTLRLTDVGGAGPTKAPINSTNPLAAIVPTITPAKATNAVDVPIAFDKTRVVVGAPKLTLNYRGTTPPGAQPTRIFAQLVDDTTGLVLGNQITPIKVTLDGKSHNETVTLEDVAFGGEAGKKLTLQLVATTVVYAKPRLGGQVQFDKVRVELPAGKVTPAT